MAGFSSILRWAFLAAGLQPAASTMQFSLSNSLQSVLDTVLSLCTIRVVLDPNNSLSSETFGLMNNAINNIGASFIVDHFKNRDNLLAEDGSNGKLFVYYNYTKPVWLLQRHITCVGHLYIIGNNKDISRAIGYHFPDFDLRKEFPQYIIFWDVTNGVQINYRKYFQLQEFYGTFMDYRLIVKRKERSGHYEAFLVCVVCWSINEKATESEGFALIPTISSPVEVHLLWKRLHSNHLGQLRLECFGCLSPTLVLRFPKLTLDEILGNTLNMSLYYTYIPHEHRNHGFITFNVRLMSNIYLMLLSVSPSFVMSNSFILTDKYRLLTVVRKSLLTQTGWTAMFTPFPPNVWLLFVFYMFFLVCLLCKIPWRDTSPIGISSKMLSVFTPCTDLWFETTMNNPVRNIVFLWSMLCLSLTVIYGGELTGSMTAFNIPQYPKSLSEIGEINSSIMSTSSIYHNGKGYSILALVLKSDISYVKSWVSSRNLSHKLIEEVEMVANQVEENYCDNEAVQYSLNNTDSPVLCKTKTTQLVYDTPVTFVELGYRSLSARIAYQSSAKFWVSPTTSIESYQEKYPLMMRFNYFAKLALPIVHSWWEGGLQIYWNKIMEREIISSINFPGQRGLQHDHSLESSRVIEINPVKLKSLLTIVDVIYVLIGICCVAFIVEISAFYCRVSLPKATNLLKMFSIRNTITIYRNK